MALDKILDARPGQAQRGAHRQPAIAFDDDGNRFTMGAHQPVNGYGHVAIVTETDVYPEINGDEHFWVDKRSKTDS